MSGIAIGLFFVLGFVLSFAGYIWGVVQAFQEETLWGLLYLLIPCAGLVFHFKNWSNLKIRKAFLMQCAGLLMFVLGGLTTSVFYGKYFTTSSLSGVNVEQGSSEQSPSSFPSDFNTSPSTSQEQSPASEQSPAADAAPGAEPNFGTVGAQQYDFKQSMKLGYAYYGQGDYQTALVNFNRALQVRPGDGYAVNAVTNTKSALAKPSKRIVQAKAK